VYYAYYKEKSLNQPDFLEILNANYRGGVDIDFRNSGVNFFLRAVFRKTRRSKNQH
jgi:hypothetical protein